MKTNNSNVGCQFMILMFCIVAILVLFFIFTGCKKERIKPDDFYIGYELSYVDRIGTVQKVHITNNSQNYDSIQWSYEYTNTGEIVFMHTYTANDFDINFSDAGFNYNLILTGWNNSEEKECIKLVDMDYFEK